MGDGGGWKLHGSQVPRRPNGEDAVAQPITDSAQCIPRSLVCLLAEKYPTAARPERWNWLSPAVSPADLPARDDALFNRNILQCKNLDGSLAHTENTR